MKMETEMDEDTKQVLFSWATRQGMLRKIIEAMPCRIDPNNKYNTLEKWSSYDVAELFLNVQRFDVDKTPQATIEAGYRIITSPHARTLITMRLIQVGVSTSGLQWDPVF